MVEIESFYLDLLPHLKKKKIIKFKTATKSLNYKHKCCKYVYFFFASIKINTIKLPECPNIREKLTFLSFFT